MSRMLSAVFINPDAAERAIGALEDHGVPRNRISVAVGSARSADAPANAAQALPTTDEFVEVQTEDPPTPTDMNAVTSARLGGTEARTSIVEAEGSFGLTTTTPADAAKGAVEGSVVGLGLGLLAGAAALLVPGVGPVLAAGPLWTALGGTLGATAAGAVAGSVTGYLRDRGVPEDVAAHYEQALGRGSVVISVDVADSQTPDDQTSDIETLLHKYGGTSLLQH